MSDAATVCIKKISKQLEQISWSSVHNDISTAVLRDSVSIIQSTKIDTNERAYMYVKTKMQTEISIECILTEVLNRYGGPVVQHVDLITLKKARWPKYCD